MGRRTIERIEQVRLASIRRETGQPMSDRVERPLANYDARPAGGGVLAGLVTPRAPDREL